MNQARFVTGSTMRHVIIMSLTSAVGMMSIFAVDLLDMFFLSLLGEVELASAIGYAGSILFFTTSVNIGLAIAMTALVSKSLGAEDSERARRYLVNVYGVILVVTAVISVLLWLNIPYFVRLLGAKGRAAQLSIDYLQIMVPSMPILGIAMASGAALRAVGDARRSMNSTLSGGAVNAVLDPIFIFVLGMGVQGAAIASVIARLTILVVAVYPIFKIHRLWVPLDRKQFFKDQPAIFKIALPAIITNIATPIGNAYVIAAMAIYGDGPVAGMSVVSRLIPVAFGIVFAASSAIGPIVGQNFGAGDFKRVRRAFLDAVWFIGLYVSLISFLLFFSHGWISDVFRAQDGAREIIATFCKWVAFTYILAGTTFISNATFNNLGRPFYSTIINFSKATVGTIPFVYYGSLWYGAGGVIVGQGIGACVFGCFSLLWALRLIKKFSQEVSP